MASEKSNFEIERKQRHSAPQRGKEITRFLLATTKRFKDGDEKDRTQWHHYVVYWNTVEFADNALRKGSHLPIEGELSYREHDRTIETDSGPVR
jgi:single stranded DNA-binding protein